ncbi:serine hydrolase domain-containing protein [Granulicoccus sp. GXG6511]|uniref:serine hydrolase domain-containing protein n=1 Tax=Granulicoccus sp. GXG6511 TaxID=3381351 RepID=UPI003D7DFCD2
MARARSSSTTSRRGLWLFPLAGALIGALLSLLIGPHPTSLGPPTGDAALAREAQAILGNLDGYGAVSVARIQNGQSAWAGFPAKGRSIDEHSRFELGSITKTFNGLLLADAVERGEVAPDDPVANHLPELAGSPAGTATLEELASHRSGLPSIARMPMAEIIFEDMAGEELSVFATGTDDLLAQARTLELTNRGTFAYSNLGAALLGHALARAGGAPDWETHVSTRLLAPLGLTETRFVPPGQRDPALEQPRLAGGRAVEAWTGSGYAPAGAGVTTTAADLTRYARAILDGSAPGMSALDPQWDTTGLLAGTSRIGLAWMSSGPAGAEMQWHNGGTGGTRTILAIDRHTQTAAIVLNSSKTDVTGAGLRLAGADDGPPRFLLSLSERDYYWILGLVPVLVLAIGALRGRNRLGVLARTSWALGGVLLIWLAAPWNWVPGWVFGLAVGAVVASLVVIGLRWGRLPWRPRRFLGLSVPVLALGAAFLALMLTVTIRALRIG